MEKEMPIDRALMQEDDYESIDGDFLLNEFSDDDIDGEELPSSEMFEHFRFVADKGQSLLRIDKFLCARIVGSSRNRIQNAAEAGCIFVNDVPVKSNYRVKPLDVVTIKMDLAGKWRLFRKIFRLTLCMKTTI